MISWKCVSFFRYTVSIVSTNVSISAGVGAIGPPTTTHGSFDPSWWPWLTKRPCSLWQQLLPFHPSNENMLASSRGFVGKVTAGQNGGFFLQWVGRAREKGCLLGGWPDGNMTDKGGTLKMQVHLF